MRAKKDRAFAGCRCTRCGEWFSEVCRCDRCGAPASAMAPDYGPARGLRTCW